VRERCAGRRQTYPPHRGVAPKLTHIEIGEIPLAPKLSEIWCRKLGSGPNLVKASADWGPAVIRFR
jgi:hypothetical protein